MNLYVVITIHDADSGAGFTAALAAKIPGVTTLADGEQLLIVVESPVDSDQTLLQISYLIDDFGGRQGALDLVEARVAPPLASRVSRPVLSKFVQVEIGDELHLPLDKHLTLTPSSVFGTGLHPSTRLAAQAMDDIYEAAGQMPARVLDVGCGSGVLALLAARLGASQVEGVDISPEAVATAKFNAERNNLAQVDFSNRPVSAIPGGFDLVIANLSGAVMGSLFDGLVRLARGGRLIISGLQGRQGEEMTARFAESGFAIVAEYREGKWFAALLVNSDE